MTHVPTPGVRTQQLSDDDLIDVAEFTRLQKEYRAKMDAADALLTKTYAELNNQYQPQFDFHWHNILRRNVNQKPEEAAASQRYFLNNFFFTDHGIAFLCFTPEQPDIDPFLRVISDLDEPSIN